MKRVIVILAVLVTIGLTSCKKEYMCDCKRIYTGNSSSTSVNDGTYTFKDSRPRAEEKCNDQEMTGSDLSGDYSRECSIR